MHLAIRLVRGGGVPLGAKFAHQGAKTRGDQGFRIAIELEQDANAAPGGEGHVIGGHEHLSESVARFEFTKGIVACVAVVVFAVGEP